MFDNILEKLEYEYSKWSNFIYAGSVSDCMSRSFEIAFKRALYQKLKETVIDFNDDEVRIAMQRKNLIDYIYLKLKDNKCLILENEYISDENFKKIKELIFI